MLIKNEFEVPQSPDRVWQFFSDIPQVAACLPGASLTDQTGPDQYAGNVTIRMGPVKLSFVGTAHIRQRDDVNRTIVVDAAGADTGGRGQAALGVTARLVPSGSGTKVEVAQDLQLSGAAAQYGRGMVADVTSVLMKDFSTNVQARIDALGRGLTGDQIGQARSANAFAIGLQAAWMALKRVGRRFFLPYEPHRT